MLDNNPLMLLPARARQIAYSAYGLASLSGIGITAYYAALPSLTVPDQVVGGLAVLGALAAPFAALAASNVRPNQAEDPSTAEARALARRDDTDPLG